MNEIGPFVALGRPGELLPEIGARTYTSNDEWQSRVLNLMSRAKLIVLRAGDTPSFLWEFEAVTKHVKPECVIVLLPYGAPYYNVFRRKIEKPHIPFQRAPFLEGVLIITGSRAIKQTVIAPVGRQQKNG